LSRHKYRIVTLPNGVCTVHATDPGETFHPVIGPVAEAETLHVRQLRLCERLARHAGEFVVWDVGLGAAANALTVLRATRDIPARIRILSFDRTLEPLRFALDHAVELGYLVGYEPVLRRLVESTPNPIEFEHGPRHVTWRIVPGNFPDLLQEWIRRPAQSTPPSPDAILWDPFSPARNPEMWCYPIFTNLHRLLDPDRPCNLATYSRSTLLRTTLLLAGFWVGIGHATGQKEETTIAANTRELLDEPLGRDWLKRASRSTSAEPLWDPVYRQRRLRPETRERLETHPQFAR
jgi:hypothetical protein